MSNQVWIALGALAAAALGALAWAGWARAVARWRWATVRRRGRKGEIAAPAVLRAAGYRVIEEQVEREIALAVDGVDRPVRVRVDLLVERRRDGARFAAEVKTGQKAPNPAQSATRRQLLEYRLAYDVEGVLLVDMEAGSVHVVDWPGLDLPGAGARGRAPHRRALRGFGAGVLAGLLLGLLALLVRRCVG